jgi:hypothetical protein
LRSCCAHILHFSFNPHNTTTTTTTTTTLLISYLNVIVVCLEALVSSLVLSVVVLFCLTNLTSAVKYHVSFLVYVLVFLPLVT